MKLLITTFILSSLLFGEIVLNKNIEQFELNNQFDQKQSITKDTKKIVFAFKKASGHLAKAFFNQQNKDYLSSRDALFVADVSAMPAVIRWFVLDDLDAYPYSIILIEDDKISAKYKEEKNIEKILVVTLEDFRVIKKEYLETEEQLKKSLN
ncbi:MAG: hypothetical protein U9O56_02545 [Campylobacterota bacterium]|nr:hypothetical protein [Campylobacterota bacterium]